MRQAAMILNTLLLPAPAWERPPFGLCLSSSLPLGGSGPTEHDG